MEDQGGIPLKMTKEKKRDKEIVYEQNGPWTRTRKEVCQAEEYLVYGMW